MITPLIGFMIAYGADTENQRFTLALFNLSSYFWLFYFLSDV